MASDTDDDMELHRSGEWLGEFEGIGVRDPGPDADGPIVEFHGSESMAAVEVTSEEFVDKLSEAAAEVQLALDDQEDRDPRTDGGEEVDGEVEHVTTCDGCGTGDCDNWRWSCWHALTLCGPCADYWRENDGELPDFEQQKLVTDGGIPQSKPPCDGCGERTWEVRLVEVENPDGVITTCDDCEDSLNSEIVEVLATYE